MSDFLLYPHLPEVFRLAEKTWGFALTDVRSVPFLFLLLGAALLMVSITGIVDKTRSALFLKWGIGTGSASLFLASALTWAAFAIPGLPDTFLGFGSIFFLVGFSVLGGALLGFTHVVYDKAC